MSRILNTVFLLTDSNINNIEIGRILAIKWLFYVLTWGLIEWCLFSEFLDSLVDREPKQMFPGSFGFMLQNEAYGWFSFKSRCVY